MASPGGWRGLVQVFRKCDNFFNFWRLGKARGPLTRGSGAWAPFAPP
jgi:hypothetical protein